MPKLKVFRRVGKVPAGGVARFTSVEARALLALKWAERVQESKVFTVREQAAPVNEQPKRAYKRRDIAAAPVRAVLQAEPEGDA